MSSTSLQQEIESEVSYVLQVNSLLVAVLSLGLYDYLLNLGLEIEFIWGKKLTLTTLIYVIMRYIGLAYVISDTILDLNLPFSGLTCFGLFVLAQISVLVITFFLQGMMSIRVYVLLGRPVTILIALGVCFAVTQIFSIAASIFFFAPGSVYWSEAQLLSINFCNDDIPTNRDWTYPAYTMTVLAYEVILCALALHHAFKHIPVSVWREPARAAAGLGSIIVQDNLVYFCIVLVSMTLSSVNFVPALSNSIAYIGLEKVMQLTLLTMVGPWMIISLRKSYEKGTAAGIPSSNELTMSFAAAATFDEEEMEMA